MYQAGGHGGKGILWTRASRRQPAVRAASLPLRRPARFVAAPSRAGAGRVSGGLVRVAAAWRGWWARISSPTWIPARCGCTRAPPPARASKRPKLRFADVEQEIRDALPAGEIETILDNIGIPNAWGSLAQGDIPTIAATDGEILISLNRDKHGPARDYEVLLRKRLQRDVSRTWCSSSSRPTSPTRF